MMIRTRLKLLAALGMFLVVLVYPLAWWGYQVIQTQQKQASAIEELHADIVNLNLLTLDLLYDSAARLQPSQWQSLYLKLDEKIAATLSSTENPRPFLQEIHQKTGKRFQVFQESHMDCAQHSISADSAKSCQLLIGRLRTQVRLGLQDLLVEVNKLKARSISRAQQQDFIGNLLLLGMLTIMSILTLILALPMTHVLGAGLTRLLDASQHFSRGDLSYRLKVYTKDEIGTLASAFNDMAKQRQQAEAALRESEERWQFALQGSRDGVWDWDKQNDEVFYSSRWKEMLGYADDEISNSLEEWDKRVHPEDKARCYADMDRYFNGETPFYENEHRLRCKDGTYKWILDRGKVVLWATDGNPLRVIGTHTDITERKQAEAALLAREENYRLLVENQTDLVVKVDTEGRFQFISPSYCRLFGKSEDELLGHSYVPLVHEDDRETTAREMKNLYQPPYTAYLEQRAMTRDGWRWLGWMDTAVLDENGEVTAIIGVGRDITERKQAEQALVVSEEKFRNLVESSQDWIWEVNAQGVYSYVSPRCHSLLGFSPEEIIGRAPFELMPAAEAQRVRDQFLHLVNTQAPINSLENINLHKNGSKVVLETSGVPFFDEHGELAGYRGMDRDITERKQIENNLCYRLTLETALANLSSDLAKTGDDELDATIDKALGYIGSALEADRSYLFQIDATTGTFSNTHEWCATGISAQQPELQQVPTSEFQIAFERFKRGEVINLSTADKPDETLTPLQVFMQQAGIQSLINVPVIWERELRGVLGLDSEQAGKTWPQEDIQILHTVAESFAWAQARREASQRIQQHTWFLESLDKVSKTLTGTHDTQQILADLTELILEIFAVDRAWLLNPNSPDTPTWAVPIEATRTEFPGVSHESSYIPQDDSATALIHQAMQLDHPLIIQSDEFAEPPEFMRHFQVQSIMAMALPTQAGNAWLLGVHQCSRKRVWTSVEQRLFQTTAERAGAALSGIQLLEQVRENERRLLEAEHIAHMGEWELDIDTGKAHWSDMVHEIFGTKPSQEVGPAFLSSVVNPQDWPVVMDSLQAAMQHGTEHEMEYRIYRPDGEERWLYCKAQRNLDPTGKPLKLTGIAQDVTERKQAESALRESEARYRVVFNQQFQFMAILSPDGITLDINELPLRMTSAQREDYVGQPFWLTPAWKDLPEWREIWPKRLSQAAETSGPIITEDVYQTADGGIRYADAATTAIRDDAGNTLFYLIQASDTTERRRAEEERNKLFEEIQQLNQDLEIRVQQRTAALEVANKELESFSYSVSHDLRAPLRAIDGFSLALVEDYGNQLDDTAHDYLRRVRNGAQRMGMLIDDLLQLSRVSRGELRLEEVDLGEVAVSVIEELKASEPGRQLDFTLGEGLQVQGDARLLRVMLDNLLGNAWKFSSREAISRIALERHEEYPQVFTIRDNGVGFDMRHADKLFGAFQRLHRTNDFPGTGVGLATVQRIVHRHGGKIWAEAQEGKGASFYFTLERDMQALSK